MSSSQSGRAAQRLFVAAAPWVFVLLWSTGFIGARFGLPYIEPFTFLAMRFVIVALLLGALALLLHSPWPRSPAAVGHIVVVGLLIQGGFLGGVFIALTNGMTAGLAALITSMQPILVAIISPLLLGEGVNRIQWLGLLAGFVGVGMVVGEKIFSGGAVPAVTTLSFSAALVALFSTTAGTLYQKRFGLNMPLVSGTCIQFIGAAIVMSILALTLETRQINWTGELIFAMIWLIFVLSIGAILLLMLLIRLNSATSVSGLFYLVPPATALEAYLIFGERLGWLALAGMAVASLGVALVVARLPARRPAETAAPAD